jgi:inner membrane protein
MIYYKRDVFYPKKRERISVDPVTHAAVSFGIFSLANSAPAPFSPSLIGNIVGSLAPDFDIVLRMWGPLTYLKNHRAQSHSVLGITAISAFTASLLTLIPGLPSEGFFQIFFWTLLGALSHSILDILNSHGIKLLWPFSCRSFSIPLLNIFDPFFIFPFFLITFLPGDAFSKHSLFLLAMLYLIFRFYIRCRIARYLKLKYRKKALHRVLVMPSMFGIFSWIFIVETKKSLLVGSINSFPKKLFKPVLKELLKCKDHPMVQLALNSKPGQIFKSFTPFYYIDLIRKGEYFYVQFYDLRYLLKDRFLHSATVIVSEEGDLLEGLFHPFSPENCIAI